MAARKTRRVVKKPAGAPLRVVPATLVSPPVVVPHAVSAPPPPRAVWPAVAASVIDLWKATLDNALDSTMIFQGIVEETVVDAVDAAGWCPGELKQAVHETVGFLRRTRKDLRATLDRNHALATAWLDRMRGVEPDPTLDAGLLVH